MTIKEILEKIKTARVHKGWSQTDITEKLNEKGLKANQTTYSSWERGNSAMTIEQLLIVATVLEIEIVIGGSLQTATEPFTPYEKAKLVATIERLKFEVQNLEKQLNITTNTKDNDS